jgi:hypothetical protein
MALDNFKSCFIFSPDNRPRIESRQISVGLNLRPYSEAVQEFIENWTQRTELFGAIRLKIHQCGLETRFAAQTAAQGLLFAGATIVSILAALAAKPLFRNQTACQLQRPRPATTRA